MSRTNARKNAFSLLFQFDFVGKDDVEANKEAFFEENHVVDEDEKEYITKNVSGAIENVEEIDKLIEENLKGWTIDRINKVDLAILRLAVYEMNYSKTAPQSVVINEAVELAKKYSSDQGPSFVNGILGKISQRG